MSLITAQGIAQVAVELLVRTLVLPRTVVNVPGVEFDGSNGDSLTIRVRTPRTARVQITPFTPITYDELAEVPVTLRVSHLYDAARLSDEELTLDVVNFAAQVSAPQIASICIAAENMLADVMNALTPSLTIAADGSDVEAQILAAREQLAAADVPLGGRTLAVSPQVATFILKLDKFTRVDASGSASALRDATIGRLYGFDVVESPALSLGTALAYHSSAFLFATKAPAIPRGASSAAAAVAQGIALRQLFGFDTSTLSDASVVSTFAGAALVVDSEESGSDEGGDVLRVVKLDTSL